MPKNSQDTEDKKPLGGNDIEDSTQEREAPPSVRDSIRAAVEEHSQEEDSQTQKDQLDAKKEKEDKKAKDKDGDPDEQDAQQLSKGDVEDKSDEPDKSKASKDDEDTTTKTKEIEAKDKAPSILPKEIQKDWDKLPTSTKSYVTKVQKELADTKADLGRRIAHYRDLDTAIAPYLPAIQQWGATPAQTVDRLFQWMNALTGQHKYQAIQQLAEDFGIDLPGLYRQAGNQQVDPTQIENQNNQQRQQQDIDPRLLDALEAMNNEVNNLKTSHQQQRQVNAAQTVEGWAGLQADGSYKNKPHFQAVRQLMYSLLSSGAIPLINGSLDLDTAYESACYSHPDVRDLLLAEREETRLAKLKEAKDKKAAEDKAKVAKARSLNMGLKPSSPTGNVSQNSKNKSGKSLTVRESIMNAINEQG